MKNLVNKVQLIGHLGKDVEMVEVGQGRKIAKVSLATNGSYTGRDGQRVEHTDWHNLVAWGKTAELMANLGTKGARVAISGKIGTRSYDDKTGAKKYVTEITVDDFMMLSPKQAMPF